MSSENDKSLNLFMRVAENGEKIIDTFTKGAVAYLGYKSTSHWTGALIGLVALRLATGGNLAGGVAGTAILTTMGLSQLVAIPEIGEIGPILEGASTYLRSLTPTILP